MRKKVLLIISCLMLLAVAVFTVPKALAYFTDFETSQGSGSVSLTWRTELKEEVKDNNKYITVLNTADKETGTPCLVRVQVFGEDLEEYITVAESDGYANWVRGINADGTFDGWWYYQGILSPGESTGGADAGDELLVMVNQEQAPADFNIIVVHESSRVTYENNTSVRVPDGWNPPDGWALAAGGDR